MYRLDHNRRLADSGVSLPGHIWIRFSELEVERMRDLADASVEGFWFATER